MCDERRAVLAKSEDGEWDWLCYWQMVWESGQMMWENDRNMTEIREKVCIYTHIHIYFRTLSR